jgi:hypothetical protein
MPDLEDVAMNESGLGYLFGAMWSGLIAWLLWLAPTNVIAWWIFVLFAWSGLLLGTAAAIAVRYFGRRPTRNGLPAWASCAIDFGISAFAVYQGGWLAIAGIALVFATIAECELYGDLPTRSHA